MLFEGKSLKVDYLEPGIAEILFDAAGSVNKFDIATLKELRDALTVLDNESDLQGVLVSSAKGVFIVGADITEFLGMFSKSHEELMTWAREATDVFDALEDLKVPTVAAVNGFALGGGCECILATDLRVASTAARIGLPEVKLGLMPGFGGTVRLSRLIGADNAIEWIATGKDRKADQALAEGVVDAVVAPENLKEASLNVLRQAIGGKIDWRAKRLPKLNALTLNQVESAMVFTTAKGMVAAKAGKHYPAPMMAVNTIEAGATLDRDGAMRIENENFIALTQTNAATAQVGIFLNDQLVKGIAKKASKVAQKVSNIAVLGAGIMGGGIAYQAASKGSKVVMKDINDNALQLGLDEAAKLLNGQIARGRSNPQKMAAALNNITPSLHMQSLEHAELVVEAVVELQHVKEAVLAEVEQTVGENAIVTSNTSTISISELAKSLKRPEKFCGMHFFNPVHKMPLVEVIRGEHTSDDTVATVVAYAASIGKTPIVVNDCPGFFVNRVLFPMLAGFGQLVAEGADFAQIDNVMEKEFGWPMGPAYLLDVVGIDTAHHCQSVMAEGIPERMSLNDVDPVKDLYENKRFGQKNGVGFYQYVKDKKGKIKKTPDPAIADVMSYANQGKELSKDDIIQRCMVPMINETVRCLEEGIVSSPAEADMALLYGLGFPAFRGGVFRHLDTIGLDNFVNVADKWANLGAMYQVTDTLRDMAKNNKTFY